MRARAWTQTAGVAVLMQEYKHIKITRCSANKKKNQNNKDKNADAVHRSHLSHITCITFITY
jgi:hypothetical protein